MGEYTQALDQALKYKNDEQAKKIIQDMEQFQAERQGGANKVLDQFNLMGDQYLEDRFKNKQAEYARKDARDQMKELIKEGVRTQNPELLKQAAQLDPTYLKDAIKAVTQELATEKVPDDIKRKLYQVEQKKTEQRMLPFYTKWLLTNDPLRGEIWSTLVYLIILEKAKEVQPHGNKPEREDDTKNSGKDSPGSTH